MNPATLNPFAFTAKQFLSQHGLDQPDGRPLYNYRLSDEGFLALRTLIGRWPARSQMVDPSSRYIGAVFCLFVAEWFRRDFQEGHWSWDGPCGAVGLAKDFPTLHGLTATGLGFWRQGLLRGADNSREYLHSLIVQGGIPTAFAARGDGWLSAYVRAVMGDLEAGADLSSEHALRHARFHDHRVPVSFRVAPFVEIVAQLSARLAELRREARAGAGQSDVVGWLDGFSPGWRESLPIAMADGSAACLIEGLVRLRPDAEASGSVTVERLLLRDPTGGGYRFAARLALDGTLDLTQPLPPDVFADLAGRTRARLFPSGSTAERVTGCLAILEPPGSDETKQRADGRRPWSARAVLNAARRLLAPFPFEADVEVRLHADNRDVATFVLPAGRRVLESVLSFRAIDDEGPPRELRLIGSGSVRTREAALYFTVADAADVQITCDAGTIETIARFAGLTLHRLTGQTRITTRDGVIYRLRTASDDEVALRLDLSGPSPDDLRATVPLFCGQPAIRVLRPGNVMTSPPAGSLRWRPLGVRAAWQVLDRGSSPIGLVEVGLFEDDALQDRVRLAIVPAGARVQRPRPPRDAAAIVLEGFGAVTFEPRPRDPQITVTQSHDPVADSVALTARSDRPLPQRLHIELRRPGRTAFEVQVPLIGREVAFYAASGRRLRERAEIGLADLRGLTVEASAPGRIDGEVHARGSRGEILRFTRRFERSLPAAALRAEIEALLAASDDLDAVMRLTACVGPTECRIDVRRYALALEPDPTGLRVEARSGQAWCARPEDEGGAIALVARRFADLCGPEIPLSVLMPADFAGTAIGLADVEGPVLYYARRCADGRVVSRPLLAAGGRASATDAPPVSDRLAQALLIPARNLREEAIRACLHDLGRGRYPEAANAILALVRTFSDVLAPQTFDLLRHLSAAPRAMVEVVAHAQADDLPLLLALEEQLPFAWVSSPLTAWMKAFVRRRERLEAALSAASSDATWRADLATREACGFLDGLEAIAPTLAIHVRAAKLGLGIGDASEVFGTGLDGRVLAQGVRTLASACVGRNQGRDDWPRHAWIRGDSAITTLLPSELSAFAAMALPMLDAPYVAAALALDQAKPSADLERRLRVCRFYDPAYFELAFPHAVRCLWARISAA